MKSNPLWNMKPLEEKGLLVGGLLPPGDPYKTWWIRSPGEPYYYWKRTPTPPGLLTRIELQVYKIPQCSLEELEKFNKFHERLNIPEIMTLKGMYIIFHQELRALNLDKIHSLEQLCIKRKRYRKYLRSKTNREKLKRGKGK